MPDTAEAPFVCDGVPQEGAELILGGSVAAERTEGSWDAGSRFNCAVAPAAGGEGTILITSTDVEAAGTWGDSSQTVLSALSEQGDAAPIDAGAPGEGYAFGDGSAGWVCSDRFTLVVLDDVATQGRDRRADAERLLTSMLPWACGAEEAPPSTAADD